MIVMIDNYDSFTWNLVQLVGGLDAGREIRVYRNDAVSVADLRALRPSHIIISPGPGRPDNGGISLDVVEAFAGQTPLLGVCLGHQCIVQVYGGAIVRADRLMHGKTSRVEHTGSGLFAGVPQPLTVMRYHSLTADPARLPAELVTTAWTVDSPAGATEVMGVRHSGLPIYGVQFHPESFRTAAGDRLLANFLGIEYAVTA